MKKNKILVLILALFMLFSTACGYFGIKQTETQTAKEDIINLDEPEDKEDDEKTDYADSEEVEQEDKAEEASVVQGKSYYEKEEVAEYIHKFGELPQNYLTKSEAAKLGWESREGNLWDVTDKGVIGGDRFGNREKKLPNKSGRTYYECDVNYSGGHRGAERLVYSNDGLIFYSPDHYNTFEELRFD
ncbi:ribonuclease domain-containing protein [Microaceticoccus formicicus]|uniref:ribonuclease domain-containing protein n=1 Tax=Microaceticoccus formicicus TaxID=3118105 RepID=UPI003CD00A74|nr:ribonuclease domain-containing protein [Peptoniphilaceae bacterium AMB_02]